MVLCIDKGWVLGYGNVGGFGIEAKSHWASKYVLYEDQKMHFRILTP